MKKIKNKKVIAFVLLVLTLFISINNLVYGATEISKANLKKIQNSDSQIQFKGSNGWYNVQSQYIGYTEKGKIYPAYCISHGLPGVDELGPYTVSIDKTLDDVRIWRTIINGFPYKSAKDLGVETDIDAYVATKQAIYSVILHRDVYSLYRGRTSRGDKIVKAIYNLANIGLNGTQTPEQAQLKIYRSGEIYEQGDYFIQRFNVSSDVDIASYTITSSTIPNGAIITDSAGNQKTTFTKNESCYLKIPKSSMSSDINAVINIQGKCKTYPVFFGITPKAESQNYAVTYDPYGDDIARATLNIKTNNAKIIINKVDKDTGESIQDTTFQLCKLDGTVVANATTNSKGVAEFNNLYQSTYIVKEICSNEKYILDTTESSVFLNYGETKILNLTNEHKKGSLKVIKVDKDNKDIAIGGVKFELYSKEFNKVIGTYTTNANGEIIVNDLRIR